MPGDKVQVDCSYDPTLRQELPTLRNLPPRFVTWGDGSSDEMCLGLVMTVPPAGIAGGHRLADPDRLRRRHVLIGSERAGSCVHDRD